jgi:hypothetical protein
MASKFSPSYGDNALKPYSGGLSEAAAPRRERAEKRPTAMSPRQPSEELRPAAPASVSASAPTNFDPSSSREALIATAAYYRAEKRGFAPGYEDEDWLGAEREIDGTGKPPNR